MNNMNSHEHPRGALVYIPAGVRLRQLDEQNLPVRWVQTPKPTNVLLIEETFKDCQVIYAGEQWTVNTTDIYPPRVKK